MTDRARLLPIFDAWRRVKAAESPWKGSVQHVALALALHADADTGEAFPSAERLARETGYSESTIHRALKVLLRDRPLFAETWKPGRRTPTRTLVSDPAAFVEARDRKRKSEGCHGDTQTQGPKGVRVTPLGCHGDRGGVSQRHPNTFLNTAENRVPPTPPPGGAGRSDRGSIREKWARLFESKFLPVTPRVWATQREGARKAWNRRFDSTWSPENCEAACASAIHSLRVDLARDDWTYDDRAPYAPKASKWISEATIDPTAPVVSGVTRFQNTLRERVKLSEVN